MPTDIEDPPRQTAGALLSGVLGDLHHLVEQQFQLTRREIEEELRQRAAAMAVLGLGAGLLFLAAMALCLGTAHLLHHLASPPLTDLASLPLWACHAVVTVVLAIIGGILVRLGRARFRSVAPFQNPATEVLQEHVPWTTPPK